jgi:hypothetical protein
MAETMNTSNAVPMTVARFSKPLFSLGRCVLTCGAEDVLDELEVSPFELLYRHQTGDWGILDPEDWDSNINAVKNGRRVFSCYPLATDQTRIYVITEANRSVTTILLPDEY